MAFPGLTSNVSPLRLRAIVPALHKVVHAKPSRAGFTLIEIMVAIALSTLIILCAVSCFRMVSKAIATATAMSNENALLRTGLQLAWLDVDYWHSYADPNPPYGKGWARLPTGTGTGTAEQQNIWRRPFQPIRFIPRTDTAINDPNPISAANPNQNYSYFNASAPTLVGWNDETNNNYWLDPYNRADYVPNPNAMLAHDLRSIQRPAIRQMSQPEIESGGPWEVTAYGNYQKATPRLNEGDYTLVEAMDMRDPPGLVNPKYPVSPKDPTTGVFNAVVSIPLNTSYYHPPGVAYSVETPDMDPTNPLPALDTVSEFIPLDIGNNIYQPLLWTGLFQRLSYVAYEYMSPGTSFLYTDREGRTADTDTPPLPPYMYNTSSNFYSDYNSLQWERDFAAKLGNSDVATRMGMSFVPSDNNGGYSGRAMEAIPFRVVWPQVTGLTPFDYDSAAYSYPFVDIMDTSQAGNLVAGNGGNTWETQEQFEPGDQTRLDEECISQTVWLPYNITDWDKKNPDSGTDIAPTSTSKATLTPLDYVSKPSQAPSMYTAILRYGKVGGSQEFCVVRVTINDPVSGRITQLPCIPFGANFRGARQHWRLYSAALTSGGNVQPGMRFGAPPITPNPANMPAGDYYDTAAGPYYVAQP